MTESAPGNINEQAKCIGGDIDYDKFLDCVHCGLCTSACPTYLETGDENDSPRGRIYLMRSVVDGRMELTDTVRDHLDLCLDCRSCETACPSGVQYGRLIEPFRVDMKKQEGVIASASWFDRLFLYGLFPYAYRMKLALWPARVMQKLKLDSVINGLKLTRLLPTRLARMYEQLPRLQRSPSRLAEVLPSNGPRRARVGLITGCVGEAMFGHTNRATARVLQHNGCEVVVPKRQACCGAIHYHNGSVGPALEFAKKNLDAFDFENLDAIIINVAGCGSMLKDYGHIADEIPDLDEETRDRMAKFAAKVKDVSEFLVELGPRIPNGMIPLRATYHDACHLCHAQGIRDEPRELLGLIPGLELVDLAESDICCGAAGSYNLTQPEMADRLGDRKVANILDTECQAVITGNAGCQLQVEASLRRNGKPMYVTHPIELLDMSYRNETPDVAES